MLYSTISYVDTTETTCSDSTKLTEFPLTSTSVSLYGSLLTLPVITRQRREIREVEGTIRLGMGDFAFYSLMLGNTVQACPINTPFACFVFVSSLVANTL